MADHRWKENVTRIIVDGKSYSSVEAMPPEVRRQYEEAMSRLMEDRDGNGVPDVFERPSEDPAHPNVMVTTTRSFTVNGKECEKLEDLPPEVRDAVARALRGENPDGVTVKRVLGDGSLSAGASRREVTGLHGDAGHLDPAAHSEIVRRLNGEPRRDDGIWIHISWSTLVLLILFLGVLVIAIVQARR